MPIILAIQETEIRKNHGSKLAGQILHEILSQKNPSQKRAGGELKVKALSSNTSTEKRKNSVVGFQLFSIFVL
jgi:hypothetical protein